MKKPKKSESVFQIYRQPDETEEQSLARTALSPSLQSALTIREFSKTLGELDLNCLIDELNKQIGQTIDGNLDRAEAMLMAQAHTLDAIFNRLVSIGIHSDTLSKLDTYLKLGLRAQSQCRATWETLSVIKNPLGRAYVGQANIAHNQQVNNEAPSRTRENEKSPTKLSEKADDERLDSGTLKEAIRSDQALEAVGEVHWPKDA